MPMNWHKYTDLHTHPIDPTVVEFVAYQRKDQGWDLFVYEPLGSCPELENGRIDEHHIFIQHIQDKNEMNNIVEEIENRLGEDYQIVEYYREKETRRTIQKILDHLKQRGAFHMWVHGCAVNEWVLLIRKKDFPIASELISSNL